MSNNQLFPVFLKIEHLHILLVGGGNVGLEKINAILNNCRATKITVVAGYYHPHMIKLADTLPNVQLVHRHFEWEDLDGKDIVILATNDHELHREIKKETRRRNLLTNVADTPELCDFYLGSIVQKGDLKIGISTNGKSPTFAKRFREFLEDILPGELQELLDNLHVYRAKLKGDFQEKVKKLNDLTNSVMSKK